MSRVSVVKQPVRICPMRDAACPNGMNCPYADGLQCLPGWHGSAKPSLNEALLIAVAHLEHMAAWISKRNAGYSFESLGEDMPTIREALESQTPVGAIRGAQGDAMEASPPAGQQSVGEASPNDIGTDLATPTLDADTLNAFAAGVEVQLRPTAVPSKVDSIVEAVRADLLRRSQLGIAKYGVTLDRTDLNLRDWLQHAYEETLDQANYLKRAIVELERRADGGADIVMTHTNIAGGR